MNFTALTNRALIKVGGEDCETFLEGIVTCKVEDLAVDATAFGALLSPQGKILFDFFITRIPNGYLIDILDTLKDEFIKRLMMYKLRARVVLETVEDQEVFACWGNEMNEGHRDPRHPDMGTRVYANDEPSGETGNYLAHRITLGIPEGNIDFTYGNAYPHEVLMDQFDGVDFKKGCYVGQEVVSRMQHRASVKKRVVQVSSASNLPEIGTEILADGKVIGALGSVHGNEGLALLRLDRAASAKALTCQDTSITLSIPAWANFTFPDNTKTQDTPNE